MKILLLICSLVLIVDGIIILSVPYSDIDFDTSVSPPTKATHQFNNERNSSSLGRKSTRN